MEDEDGESKVMDMWSILGEQQLKDPALGNTLKHSVDGSYTDVIEDEKQLLKYNSVGTKDSPSKNSPGSKIVFKGFKKRILAQAQETQTITSRGGTQEHQAPHPNVSPKSAKEKRSEAKRGKITEYAQYLGLQPSSKYNKCTKCNSSSANFCSKQSPPCSCNPMMAPMPSTSDSSTVPHSANFKITRKVYLCAACGTYFENWNLFLHMRDIHKRHICLFCLGMFGQAERLSYHLAKKHSVPEMAFASVEEFYGAFKGSCYLVCCTCEKVFSETDNFYNHFCSPPVKQDVPAPTVCTLCRQSGTHASTCTLASVEPAKEPPREHHTTTVPIGTQTEPAPAHLLDRPPMITPGGKPVPRKPTKNNKPRYVEDGLANSHHYHHPHPHPKLNVHPRKTNAKTPPLSDNGQTGEMIWRHGSFLNNSVRDTVSETIMEVSRYVEEPNEDTAEKREDQADSRDLVTRPSEEESREKVYDTVTQTIMEVSRCGNESEEPEDAREKEESGSTDTLDASDRLDSDFEDSAKTEREGRHSPVSLRPGSAPVREAEDEPDMGKPPERTEERTEEEEEEEEDGGKADSESQGSSSPGQSPVGRSLFSPQHEPQPPTEERPRAEPEDERKRPSGPVESQAAVSFNAVPSSDRSLVIKICTNRNSQFSVTSASTSATEEKTENRREAAAASREPETNNNVEGSGSGSEEKRRPSTAERMRESNGGYGAGNELDSDSDSVKLAVVDTSDQEADEPDEEEEEEEEEEAEEEVDGTVESREEMSEPDHRGQEAARTEEEEQKQAEGTTEASANGGEHEDEEENELVDVVGQDERKDGPGQPSQPSDGIALAGEDVPCVDLNVEGTLDSIEIEELLKRCIEAASPFCVYCNHARHIAVNGRQLGLHMLAEHKFQPQHPAIIIQPEQFTVRVKRSLEELDDRFFNLTSYNSTNGTHNVTDVRTYECFHCRFRSAVHKELYLHNRKMHQKTILICIMCKSTFYSYSELLCHLCPGIYSPNINVKYRCCLCPVTNLPSAFRLMVHLRKRHHACDVCLESTGNQQRLSNHVWKHKLHHLCYRCGIAYRNKPDITKHLFWKHGTESVLCKKCLQKKWPHIYHFCIPPTAFVCEECGSSFSRAVALKVHKRLHSGDQPYTCQECPERFISQKLLGKHEATHREQQTVIDVTMTDPDGQQPTATTVDEERTAVDRERTSTAETATTSASADLAKETKEPVKKVVDVYDLPPLNLSSESDTDTEEEKPEPKEAETAEKPKPGEGNEESSGEPTKSATSPVTVTDSIVDVERNEEEKKHEAQIMDGIWDNFKSYTASLEMKESVGGFPVKEPEPEPETDVAFLRSIVLADHDYCVVWSEKDKQNETDTTKEWGEEQGPTTRTEDGFTGDQDYSVNRAQRSPTGNNLLQSTGETDQAKKKTKTPKKKKQQSGSTSSSDSSSDSDSSSCSCGTNCSCSSSSSGSSSSSSSSSDSDSSGSESSPRKQQQQQSGRKERKKEKEVSQESIATAAVPTETVENKKKEPSTATAPPETENGETIVNVEQTCPARPLLRESDLETDETETDEDFYDEHPQQLANKLLAEKRNQLLLLAAVAPASTDSSMPLNNGITETDSVAPSPDPITAVADEQPQQKRKVKTKKRKKADRSKQRNTVGQTVESIKLNIPKAYYQKSQGFAAGSSSPAVTLQPSRSSTPNLSVNDHHHHQVVGNALGHLEQQAQQLGIANQSVGGSGSETETKRSSKRKRIPKRFYGDSSDEEADKQPAIKWRKVETPSSFAPVPAPVVKPIPATRLSFGGKTLAYNRPVPAPLPENQTDNLQVTAATSATESEEPADTSTDSSDSEVESTSQPQTQSQPQQTQPHLQLQLQLQMQSQSQSQNQPQSQLQLHQLHQLQTQSQQSQPVQPQPQLQLQPHPQPNQPETTGTTTGPVPTEQRSVNLYCYCQCPYDEVSEMIACDGEDCRIEWFHFECVGIMVPPKGKWYCPDCRKKHGILHNSEDYFD